MRIHKFTPFIPANIKLEIDNQVHDIFVLVSLSPLTVQIPDEWQHNLVRDSMKEFTEAVGNYLNQPPNVEIPNVPEDVMMRAREMSSEAKKREQELRQAHDKFEQDRRSQEQEPNLGSTEAAEGNLDAL